MASAPLTNTTAPAGDLPDEIYIAFVDGFVTDLMPAVLLAAVAVTCGEIAAAIAAERPILLYAAPVQLLIASVRLYLARRHAKNLPSPTVEVARKQERIFSRGALASLAGLSLWTLLAFWVTDNSFAQFIGVSMTIAYAFSLMSRSYAIFRGVNQQLLVAFVPLSVAMIVAGGWYPLGIFVGLLPLALYMNGSAKRLRANFTEVITAQQKAATLATRLDTALNNMSHGLCMIDSRGRLILTNGQALKIFGVPPRRNLVGANVNPILRGLGQSGVIAPAQLTRLTQVLFRDDEEGADFVVPLETRDGRAFEVTIHRMKSEGSVVVIQDVTERRNAQIEINRMARFDAVTDLPNRRCFEEELALSLRSDRIAGTELTVMFLDLDNFKQVNDSLGHATGDKLLAEIARRLSAIVSPRDMVARWGGDEFIVLHRHGADQPQTSSLAKRIIEEIGRAVVIDGSEVIVGASIGTASAPIDGATPDILLSNADIALYAAKADGRRGWRAFEREMDTKIQVRRLVELELRAAVATGAIDLHFQPIVHVKTGRVASFEALARWRHPVRGAVSPGEFIPIVEEIGLMEEFGACVLRRACEACASWPEDVSVSVNLSPSQFRSGNIETIIAGALKAAGLQPDRLDLEITESTLLDDRGDARRTLESLRARGCRISLDDFGTGYSSLSYLLSFPLDRVKIDRSFTMGLGIQERASILVESVAAMSRKLGMSVLIEGVETERQMQMIEQLGTIAEVQGFLFSPPIALADAAALVGPSRRRAQAAAA
jgi:diguanylate cyclase (GGDEF)-like protein/PAS domain S-box-containing protein